MALTDAQIAAELIADISGDFSAYVSATLEPYVAEARFSVNASFWGTRYDLAVKLMAGHLLTERIRGGNSSGAIASKTAGALSISYATADGVYAGAYGSTNWGQRYQELLATQRYKTIMAI